MQGSSINPNELLTEVLISHIDSAKWNDAPFERIKRVSNSKVGAVGQDFVEKLAVAGGVQVDFPSSPSGERLKQSPWDIALGGIKFELKTATEDVSGCFQFNHIRYHRKYDALICLGISPSEIFFQLWTKAEVTTGVAGNLVSMEKSANASYKLTKRPSSLLPIERFLPRLSDFISNWNA